MFSAVIMSTSLMYHETTSWDCTNTVMTCVSDAAGQRRSRLTRLAWREEHCGVRRRREVCSGGSWAARGMSGPNSHKNSNKFPVRYRNTFEGELMTVVFILKYLLMKKKCVSSRKGTFLIQGKRGGAWAPLGVHLCTCLYVGVGSFRTSMHQGGLWFFTSTWEAVSTLCLFF